MATDDTEAPAFDVPMSSRIDGGDPSVVGTVTHLSGNASQYGIGGSRAVATVAAAAPAAAVPTIFLAVDRIA